MATPGRRICRCRRLRILESECPAPGLLHALGLQGMRATGRPFRRPFAGSPKRPPSGVCQTVRPRAASNYSASLGENRGSAERLDGSAVHRAPGSGSGYRAEGCRLAKPVVARAPSPGLRPGAARIPSRARSRIASSPFCSQAQVPSL